MFIFSWIKNLFVKPEPVSVFEAVYANYGVHIDEPPVDTVVVDMNTNWPFPSQADMAADKSVAVKAVPAKKVAKPKAVKAVPAKKVAAKKVPKSK
jgi:hypothetical protein|tara:strand:- start:1852 stop:2136 length:285 start_codon:yes stop_codon:yes gene_type:complete